VATAHPIPGRLNLAIAALQLALLLALLWLAGRVEAWWSLGLVALGYGVVMNSAYAMLHEAEHNILHPRAGVNTAVGVVLALFFPAPFHLLRQGHLGHHVRNRSDDEAFDFYFEGDNPVWRFLQLYGTLTGFFWLVIAFSNLLAALHPRLLQLDWARRDRPTAALIDTLNPRYGRLIQLEALAAIALHAGLMILFAVPPWKYALVLAGFGVMWSALQYVHHFGTVRDVQKGALNLRTFAPLDVLWLNHNWHLNHHLSPTVPWIYLPFLPNETDSSRGNLVLAYLRMWRGPRLTHVRVQNRHAGKIIR
jgi:fatty acid desaturase